MIPRAHPLLPLRPLLALITLVCAIAAGLSLPGTSGASGPSGGASFTPPPGSTASAQPANLTVSASANGMTIAARQSALLRTAFQVTGSLPAAEAGRTVEIELMGARTGWSWQPAAQTRVHSDGTYAATWDPNRAGQYAVRAVVEQPGAVAATGLPTITVIVYRPAVATLYGPGFYGRRTACGRILRKRTIGVANRTLRCGARVAVYYGGRMLIVPVIDRGPYANGANWDLTMATGKALGMHLTAAIGAAPLAAIR